MNTFFFSDISAGFISFFCIYFVDIQQLICIVDIHSIHIIYIYNTRWYTLLKYIIHILFIHTIHHHIYAHQRRWMVPLLATGGFPYFKIFIFWVQIYSSRDEYMCIQNVNVCAHTIIYTHTSAARQVPLLVMGEYTLNTNTNQHKYKYKYIYHV